MSVLESKKVLAKYINQATERSFFNTLKIFIILFSITFLWGCSNEIDNIKNSTPEGISSLTIGELLDNHKEFVEPKWTSFKTAQGEDVVEFTAKIKDPLLPELDKFYVRTPFKVQFLLNKKDDGYKIGYVGYEFELKDPELVEKIKLVKRKPDVGFNGVTYYLKEEDETPINLKELFEPRFSDAEIFNLIYSTKSILANEVFYNTELRDILQRNVYLAYYLSVYYTMSSKDSSNPSLLENYQKMELICKLFGEDLWSLEYVKYFELRNEWESGDLVEISNPIESLLIVFYYTMILKPENANRNLDFVLDIIEAIINSGNYTFRAGNVQLLYALTTNDINERIKIAIEKGKSFGIDWEDSTEEYLTEYKHHLVPTEHIKRLKAILPKVKVENKR